MSKAREEELADYQMEEELGEYGKIIRCKGMAWKYKPILFQFLSNLG